MGISCIKQDLLDKYYGKMGGEKATLKESATGELTARGFQRERIWRWSGLILANDTLSQPLFFGG